jgi:diguanylate cyclase (GGDEF)-like protein/PAS domain S-box-containing protein
VAEYEIEVKGTEFVDSFVDPGSPFDPADGPPDVWFRRVLEHLPDFVIAFQHDGTVTYVSDSSRFLLGLEPRELVGTNALDLLHPDDLENAAETVYQAAQVEGWRPARPFRLRHADGSYATFEVSGLSLFHVPEVAAIICIGHWADEAARVNAIVGHLAAGSPINDIVDEIVHLMTRPGWEVGVSIQYDDGRGELAIAHTGLPDALLALDRDAAGSPWATAIETGKTVIDIGLVTVDPSLAAVAHDTRYRTCWAIPVPDPGHTDALIVAWNYELVEIELGQQILLEKLQNLLELALAGRSRAHALEVAASTDPLTGLANRRAFERDLSAAAGTGFTLLLLDLDGFKAVNDEHGHAAGDTVIRDVGARIHRSVRQGDLSARIGGDEFAVLCAGLTDEAVATGLAGDLLEAVRQPVVVGDTTVEVGVSIGIATSTDHATAEQLLRAADHALYDAKQSGRNTFRLASA